MADGKWISDLVPGMPLTEAARRVMPARFRIVLHYLPLASQMASKDVEHVHQLRVASRRANAALEMFAPCLPVKLAKCLRRSLRSLRRAAGAARDWDVFVAMLQGSSSPSGVSAKATHDFLTGIVAARRIDAQKQLVEIAENQGNEFAKEAAGLLDNSIEWVEHGDCLGDLANVRTAALIKEIEQSSTPPPKTYEDLHQLRILGKKMRYSMEVFVDCFARPYRDRIYPAIEEMQEVLGQVTDAHVAIDHLTEIRDHLKAFRPTDWPRYQKPIEQLLRTQRQILPRERKQFVAWLPKWRKLIGEINPTELTLKS